MIYDKGKIFLGLAIFVALVASPFWYNPVFGTGTTAPPEVKLPKRRAAVRAAEGRDAGLAHAGHLRLARDGRARRRRGRTATPTAARRQMSLSNTCLGCHEGKKKFCDTCHEYLAVQPFCWDCHFDPKEQV